jgi:hypothetical protein
MHACDGRIVAGYDDRRRNLDDGTRDVSDKISLSQPVLAADVMSGQDRKLRQRMP